MKVCCDLEVDVNGEEFFLVDMKVLATFSGKLSRLFGKSTGTTDKLKVIFHDFPGGPKGFELITRFCYSKGKIKICPSNVFLLYCSAKFMEMNKDSFDKPNLVSQTEKYLEGIQFWTWSELLVGLKQCQDLLKFMSSSSKIHEFLKSIVERLSLSNVSSPSSTSSASDRSSFVLSSDISTKWFEDLVFLNINLFETVIRTMMAQKVDHSIICSFILDYQKSKLIGASRAEKSKIIETVIDSLFSLDGNSVLSRCLFDVFRVSLSLNIRKSCKTKLEKMVGSRLDQATLDDLLVQAPNGKKYMYDVNLILRLHRWFLLQNSETFSIYRVKKVASLMDMYIGEVAPDRNVKPSKFVALVMALPDCARDSYDRIYQAMDMYFEVHGGLCEEQRMRLCSVVNCDKLSLETLNHLSQNPNFLSGKALISLLSRQSKLEIHPFHYTKKDIRVKNEDSDQILLNYAEKFDFSTENEKQIGANTQVFQWRVLEPMKIGMKTKPQMENIMKSRSYSSSNTIALPKLCHDINFL